MRRTASLLAIAVAITATIITIIAWLVPLAGTALVAFVRHDPDGAFWIRVLTPVLPAFSLIAFGLFAVRRRCNAN